MMNELIFIVGFLVGAIVSGILFSRRNGVDGYIYVSDGERGTIWDIQTDNPEKVTEANGQIVRFKVERKVT